MARLCWPWGADRPGPARLHQQLGQGPGLLGEQAGIVAAEEFGRVGAEHRGAARLQDHHGDAGSQVGEQGLDGAAQHVLGHAELAGGDPGQTAAYRLGWHVDREPGPLQHGHRVPGDLWVEVVAERVGPQDYAAAGTLLAAASGGVPGGEALPREAREISLGINSPGPFGQRRKTRSTAGQVHHCGQAGHGGHQAGQHRQPAHRVVGRGPDPARVVVGQELRLVGGHVHPHRALLTAALAGQAQVEGVADLGRVPAAGDHLAADHLHQQPSASPGGVLLLPGDPVARAHHPSLVAAALADADAAGGSAGAERAAVVRVVEERPRLAGEPAAQGEVLVQPVRVDHLAGIHPVVRVEDVLQLTEGADEFGAEHLRQQLAPGLAVAVLAGQRSAVGDHEVRRMLGERPVVGDALVGTQLEGDAGVDAAVAEVAVQRRAVVFVAGQQRAEVAEVVAEPFRRHRGVLPAFVGLVLVWRVGGGAEAQFPDRPQVVLDRGVLDVGDVRPGVIAAGLRGVDQ